MISFRNWLEIRYDEDRERSFSDSGCSDIPEFFSQIDDTGNIVLKKKGVTDLYAEIQSHRDSVDLGMILERFKQGDERAAARLQSVQGMFGDFATVPKTYAEMFNKTMAAQDYFDHLPVEEKMKFDNSFEKWLMRFDQDKAIDRKDVMSSDDQKATISSDVPSPAVAE